MPIINGKIVRDKSSKKKTEKKEKKHAKPLVEEREDRVKKPAKKSEKVKTPEKKKKIPVEKVKAKASKEEDFIRTGTNAGLRIELSEFNGKDVIAIRKLYCTSADPEMKVGKGGFNLPSDKETLDSVISALKEIRKQL